MGDTDERVLLVTTGGSEPVAYARSEVRELARENGIRVTLAVYVDGDSEARPPTDGPSGPETQSTSDTGSAGEGPSVTDARTGTDGHPATETRTPTDAPATAATRERRTVGPATPAAVAAYVADHPVRAVLLDPAVGFSLETLREALPADVVVQRVPIARETDRPELVQGGGVARFVGTFLVSYAFYLLLGNPFDPFDLVTGAMSAGAVASVVSPILFETAPSVGRTVPRAVRATVFLPYLLWEVVRANVALAAVILRPSLPIDPEVVEVGVEAGSAFERSTTANAITLTPGTVTVDVRDDRFRVHTLTADSRADLRSGSLARAVAFVFHGRGE